MDFANLWNAVSAIGGVTTSVLALGALLYSIRTFNKSLRLQHYEVLDTMYWDLLKAALERPHLRNPSATRSPEQQREYDIYAHMAWCVVETIFDRATRRNGLLDIWRSAIDIENGLHRYWFDRPENEYMFRKDFRVYIRQTYPEASAGDRLSVPQN